MPISIKHGIVNENWTFTYDEEQVKLEIKKPRLPHTLFIQNKIGFKKRHPWEIFFRVLNEFVWFYDITVKDINGGHGDYCANINFLPNIDNYAIKLDNFKQEIFEKDQHLALGFYREGVSSGSAYYAFLCYSKILEIPFKNGKSKGTWIEQEISSLQGDLAVSVRDRKVHMLGGKTLGTWLRENGRNALAHADIQSGRTVRDPNNYQDWDEIKWGNAVMHELAEKAMVDCLKIKNKA
ncbi:MAG: hypothetical protein PHI59_07670 [Candidatus Omnitrophica bacterium]|jgi:hypothetical protein|nr:hypothetical protein [Candidatus Omnitrophota bacterium]